MAISKKNSTKITFLSVVCSLLVVAIHTTWASWNCPIWSRLQTTVLSVAVPFFFAASGYFIASHTGERGWWLRELVKRLRTIGIPYFFWLSVALVVIAAADILRNFLAEQPIFFAMRGLCGSGRIFFGLNLFHYPGIVPLWYLRSLLIFTTVLPVIIFCVRKIGFVFPVLLACLDVWVGGLRSLGVAAESPGWGIFWTCGVSIHGLFYFVFGTWLATRRVISISSSARRCLQVVSGIVLIVRCFLPIGNVFANEAVADISTMATLWLMWSLSGSIELPNTVKSVSFPIFLLHSIVFEIFWVIAPVCGLEKGSFTYGVIMWTVGVFIPIMIYRTLRNVNGKMASIIFGGR